MAQAHATDTAGREVTIDTSGALWFQGDYGLLLQALGNLLQNAGRYSTPGRPIHMRGEADGERVAVLLDTTHGSERVVRRGWRLRSAGT